MTTHTSYYPPYYNQYYSVGTFYSFNKNYNQHSQHKEADVGAAMGFMGSGLALAGGKISAGIVGTKLAAATGLTIATGGLAPILGIVATLGAGAIAGSVGLKVLKNKNKLSSATAKILATTAVKATKTSFKFATKVTNSFLNKSKQAISKNMQQPKQLLGNYSQNLKAEKMFISRIETLKKALKNNKDIEKDLKDLFKYKVPSQKSLKELNNLTSAYFIKKNATKNNGKINLKETKKDFKKFAKDVGLTRKETKFFESNIPVFLEYLKDNLKVTKDNQLAPFKFNIHRATQQVAKQKSQKVQQKFTKNQQKFMQKGKQQGKQQMQQQLQQNQIHQKTHTNTGYGR